MLTFLSLLGFIFLAGFIATFFFPVRREDTLSQKEIPNPNRRRMEDPVTVTESITIPKSPGILILLTGLPVKVGLGILGFFLIQSQGLFFEAEQGFNYYLQGKLGGETVKTEAIGVTWRGYAKITSMKDYLTVSSEMQDASAFFGPIPIRFSDKVTGTQKITTRFKLPDDHELFIGVVKEFRTEENLKSSALIPTITEVVSNSPYMFTGQGYASGEAPDYKFAVRDQITNGTYVMEDAEDRSLAKATLHKDSLFTVGGLESEGPLFTKKPKEVNGVIQRIPHAIMRSGIKVTQVTVPDVDFDDGFDLKLEEQRKQSALIQEFALKSRATEEETKFERAKGEKGKIIEQMLQEKAAVKEIIAVQTALAKDSIQLAQSLILEAKAAVDKRTTILNADAAAYEITKKVRAGITPETELKMRLDAQVLIETEKAKTKWPVYYMPGTGKAGGSIEALISAGMAKQLGPK